MEGEGQEKAKKGEGWPIMIFVKLNFSHTLGPYSCHLGPFWCAYSYVSAKATIPKKRSPDIG